MELIMDAKQLASMIDHTILKLEATKDDIKKVCDEAKKYNFKTVCVRSENIAFTLEQLKNSNVMPISVVDFPKGLGSIKEKIDETRRAIRDGAQEIDMVINVPVLKARDFK